jgi:malonate-semialdehyde dehydrogenase (acetylating)/methylmalonate-semialdehyde dehydrogenase
VRHSHLLKGECLPQIAEQIDATSSRALGVCAITPFNFPAMVPIWMFPLRSRAEHVRAAQEMPLTANRLAALFHETGLPGGVLNVVPADVKSLSAIARIRSCAR